MSDNHRSLKRDRYNQNDHSRGTQNNRNNRRQSRRPYGDFEDGEMSRRGTTSSSTPSGRSYSSRGNATRNNNRNSSHHHHHHHHHNSSSQSSGPLMSVEGWIIFATGVHEEAQEEDIHDAFSDFGKIENIRLNLDTLTGFCKGYCLIEYKKKSEAQDAINALHGAEILGKPIHVNWAFMTADSGNSTMGGDMNMRPRKKTRGR